MHIATRHYHDRHPVTHEWFDLQDRLYRKSDGEFALVIAGEFPGDVPVAKSLSLPEVYECCGSVRGRLSAPLWMVADGATDCA